MKKAFILFGILLLVAIFFIWDINRYDEQKFELEFDTLPSDSILLASAIPEDGSKIARMLCVQCHVDNTTGLLAGDWYPGSPRLGNYYAPNISSHTSFGMGKWKLEDLFVLLRAGIKHDGTKLTFMPRFSNLSDQDIISLYVYLRSAENIPVDKPNKPSRPSLLGKLYIRYFVKPLVSEYIHIQHPDKSDLPAYGKYLADHRYQCYFCHSRHTATNDQLFPERSKGYYLGNNPQVDHDGNVIRSSDITFGEASQIKDWTLDDFKKAIKTGIKPDGTSFTDPMYPYSDMDDLEAEAIYVFLNSLKE